MITIKTNQPGQVEKFLRRRDFYTMSVLRFKNLKADFEAKLDVGFEDFLAVLSIGEYEFFVGTELICYDVELILGDTEHSNDQRTITVDELDDATFREIITVNLQFGNGDVDRKLSEDLFFSALDDKFSCMQITDAEFYEAVGVFIDLNPTEDFNAYVASTFVHESEERDLDHVEGRSSQSEILNLDPSETFESLKVESQDEEVINVDETLLKEMNNERYE